MRKTTVGLLVFAIAAILPSAGFAADSGSDLFKTKCAMCHGPKGNAKTPLGQKQKLRNLASPEVQKLSDAELAQMIANGGPAKKATHAFRTKGLTDKQVKLLVDYIRTLPKAK